MNITASVGHSTDQLGGYCNCSYAARARLTTMEILKEQQTRRRFLGWNLQDLDNNW